MSQILNSMHEGNCFSSPRVFEKLLEKPYFIFKMTGPAMVRPASSDFLESTLIRFWESAHLRQVPLLLLVSCQYSVYAIIQAEGG